MCLLTLLFKHMGYGKKKIENLFQGYSSDSTLSSKAVMLQFKKIV